MYPHPPINGLQAFLAHSLALQKSQNRRSRRFCVFVFYLYPYGVPIQAERDICRCESQYGFNCRPAGLASNKALIIARAAGQTIICWCGKHCCWSHPLLRIKAPAVTCHPVDLLPVSQYEDNVCTWLEHIIALWAMMIFYIPPSLLPLFWNSVNILTVSGVCDGQDKRGRPMKRKQTKGRLRRWQSPLRQSKDTTIKIKRLKRHSNQNQKTKKTQQSK